MNRDEFRQRLDDIIKTQDISVHIEMIETLREKYNHSIMLKHAILPGQSEFRCYEYAFDLVDWQEHELAKVLEGFAQGHRDFIWFLICAQILKTIDRCSVTSGDVAIYFSESDLLHAGKYDSGKIVTKWGKGHVWEHGLWEVPTSYGARVKWYAKPSPQDMKLSVGRYEEYLYNL